MSRGFERLKYGVTGFFLILQDKQRRYEQRIREVKMASFTPLVF